MCSLLYYFIIFLHWKFASLIWLSESKLVWFLCNICSLDDGLLGNIQWHSQSFSTNSIPKLFVPVCSRQYSSPMYLRYVGIVLTAPNGACSWWEFLKSFGHKKRTRQMMWPKRHSTQHLPVWHYVYCMGTTINIQLSYASSRLLRWPDIKTLRNCGWHGVFSGHLYRKHSIKVSDTMVIYHCEFCTYDTPEKSSLRSHMHCCHPQESQQRTCTDCGKVFKSYIHLGVHRRAVHTQKAFQCKFCVYKASTGAKLAEHIRIRHTQQGFKPFKCPYCEFVCATSNNCLKHVRNRHGGQEPRYIKLEVIPPASVMLESLKTQSVPAGAVEEQIETETVPGPDCVELQPTLSEASSRRSISTEDVELGYDEELSGQRVQLIFYDFSNPVQRLCIDNWAMWVSKQESWHPLIVNFVIIPALVMWNGYRYNINAKTTITAADLLWLLRTELSWYYQKSITPNVMFFQQQFLSF